MYQTTLNQIINQSAFHNNTIVKSENILKCLNIVLEENIKISYETLPIYRLQSLVNILIIKNKSLKYLINKNKSEEDIYKLETQIKKYTQDAVEIIKEMVKTGRIKTN